MIYRVLNTSFLFFGIFLIFIIKPNLICANNYPKLESFFKKSKRQSKRKPLSIAVKSSNFDLAEIPDLVLLNSIAATLR